MPSLTTPVPVTAYSPDTLADDERAAVLGITREGARRLVIRKRWERRKGNDGRARILKPQEQSGEKYLHCMSVGPGLRGRSTPRGLSIYPPGS